MASFSARKSILKLGLDKLSSIISRQRSKNICSSLVYVRLLLDISAVNDALSLSAISRSIRTRRSLSETGLVIKASAPASYAAIRSSSDVCPVNIITFICLSFLSLRKARKNSKPSRCGIIISHTMISGNEFAATRSPSAPS